MTRTHNFRNLGSREKNKIKRGRVVGDFRFEEGERIAEILERKTTLHANSSGGKKKKKHFLRGRRELKK